MKMTMIQIIITLLLISTVTFGQGNNSIVLEKEIENIVKKIADENMYKSSAVGYGGARTDQWKRFEALKKKATDEELIILTEHSNAAVRCYSFQALAERKHPETFKILLTHLKDNEIVKTFLGCILSGQTVGDFFLDVVTPQHVSLSAYKLSEKERSEIDSLLLFDSEIKLSAKSSLLQNIEPKKSYYKRIKEIFNSENNPNALIALSKFNNPNDIELIINWLKKKETDDQYYGLRAVRHFPDTSFFPYIEQIHQQEIKKPTGFNYSLIRMLYLTTVQFKSPESRKLIEETLVKAKKSTLKYHSEYIWLALKKYPYPIYKGIKEKIKISDWTKSEMEYWLNEPDR